MCSKIVGNEIVPLVAPLRLTIKVLDEGCHLMAVVGVTDAASLFIDP